MAENRPPEENVYDFFISYKSENIDVVRPIAEMLIASHHKVWFVEYSLDINVHLSTDEIRRQAVLAGASRCKYGICFTNEAYYSSVWCRTELNGLFECLDSERMLEISLPMPASYPQISLSRAEIEEIRRLKEKLKASPSIMFQSIAAALKEIKSIAKVEIDVASFEPDAPARRTHFAYNDNDFSLDLSEWHVRKRWAFTTDNGDLPGPRFERKFKDGLVSGHILMGPQDKNITRALSPEYISHNKADRLYYQKTAEFARVVINGLWNRAFGALRGQAICGVHLLFSLGRSQMAMTTFSHAHEAARSGKSGTFTRLYSIVVPEITDDPDVEVAFFFTFHGSFPAFCQYAPEMDRLVLSLERESISKQSIGRQYWKSLAVWIRQPMLWVTAALLLAASLSMPVSAAGWLAATYGIKAPFLLLLALITGCWSSLKSLRVRGWLASLFLMVSMLVGGFMGTTAIFILFGDRLLRSLLGTSNIIVSLFLFGITIIVLGNLIAFLLITSSRRIQSTAISRRR